jgi:RecA-family ATPase
VTSFFAASEFAQTPAPAQRWIVRGFVPDRTVTLLYGDGGTGKSLTAIQLAVAAETETKWLGHSVTGGPVIYLSAEDERDELHRRLVDVCAAHETKIEDLKQFHVWDLATADDPSLGRHDGAGGVKPTPRFDELRKLIGVHRPKLLVVDTLADVFLGEENVRSQSRGFISLLRRLAQEFDLAVLVLAHPSIQGMKTGTGTSGSTGWSNSVRSRLYLERVEGASDQRVLTVRKSNRAAAGQQIKLRWAHGAFWPIGAEAAAAKTVADNAAADEKFLALLRLLEMQGRDVSARPSRTYAPKIFAAHPEAAGFTASKFAVAMERLLANRSIRIETFGPPSKQRSRLRAVAMNGRAGDEAVPLTASGESSNAVPTRI